MADMTDLKGWAERSGTEDPTQPAPGGADGQEEEADPAEAYKHAAEEVQEAIDALAALPDDDDSQWRKECVETLTEEQQTLQEKADELAGENDGDEEDEDEEDETPEPEVD